MKKIAKIIAASTGTAAIVAPVVVNTSCSVINWTDLTKIIAGPGLRMDQAEDLPASYTIQDVKSAFLNAIEENPQIFYDEILWQNSILNVTPASSNSTLSFVEARMSVTGLKVSGGGEISFKANFEGSTSTFNGSSEGNWIRKLTFDVEFTKIPMFLEASSGWWGFGTRASLLVGDSWAIKIKNFYSRDDLPRSLLVDLAPAEVKISNKTINDINKTSLTSDEMMAIDTINSVLSVSKVNYLFDVEEPV